MKLAIRGASTGQLPLTLKAKELGHTVISFAWENGAVCKEYVDKFYPISILEKDKIAEVCRQEGVQGVVSNASDLTSEIATYVASKLGLNANDYEKFQALRDKARVRELTNGIPNLCQVPSYLYKEGIKVDFPCIVKPTVGSAKKGVSFVNDEKELKEAISYAAGDDTVIMIEKFVGTREFSVESISYKGKHYIIQMTDKENDGAPHFVELSHHQPADLKESIKSKLRQIVPEILTRVGLTNGASHIEMKIDDNDNIYMIEMNPRGGGDQFSTLIWESVGYDYLKGMIDVALGTFEEPKLSHKSYSGIYFLCKQRENRLKYFLEKQPWEVRRSYVPGTELTYAVDNYTRNGYIIYKADKKIVID